jgi:methyl-accepting chemotaxis protein
MDGPAGDAGDASRPGATIVLPVAVDRRRAGIVLTAYGAAGLVLLGIAMAFVLGAFDDGRGPLGLEAQRGGLLELLDSSRLVLADAEAAARDADDGLSSTSDAARDASRFTADLSLTLRSLAASLRLSILGSQPFAGPADDFDRVAGQAAGVAADLDQAAASIALASEDMGSLASDLGAMRARIDGVKANLAGIDAGRWRSLAAAVLAWLAMPALVSLWLGLRWWQPSLAARAARRPAR